MDLISCINILAIVCPLFYCIFLLCFKVCLINVNKRLLNNGLIYLSIFSFIVFLTDFFIFKYNICSEAGLSVPFINFNGFSLNFDFLINSKNILYLLYASVCSILLSIGSKIYFKKYKYFIFTKQRYSSLFPFLAFLLSVFISANNLFTLFVFWSLMTFGIYLFAFWDLSKNNINANISRFTKISCLGDFALFIFMLIVNKYSSSAGNIDYKTLEETFQHIIQTDAKVIQLSLVILFLTACATRLYFFPFSSYASFLSNSSNLIYLTCVSFVNSISGIYLFKNAVHCFEFIPSFNYTVYLISFITVVTSLFLLLFEKNIKIIFGHVYAIVSSIFISLYIYFANGIFIKTYFVLNLLMLFVLCAFFYFDKTETSRRIINKNNGFILERIYIFCFEKMPKVFYLIFDFIEKKIIQNITNMVVGFLEYVIFEISFGNFKFSNIAIVRNILLVFSLIFVVTLLIALFGGVNG